MRVWSGWLGSERSEAPSEARVRLDQCDNSLRITALVLGLPLVDPSHQKWGSLAQPRPPKQDSQRASFISVFGSESRNAGSRSASSTYMTCSDHFLLTGDMELTRMYAYHPADLDSRWSASSQPGQRLHSVH